MSLSFLCDENLNNFSVDTFSSLVLVFDQLQQRQQQVQKKQIQ